MLDKMWEAQASFYKKIRAEKSMMSDQEFCHSLVLHLHKEVSELLDAIGGQWKTHVEDKTTTRKSQILMETVDVTKLAWEAAIAAGVTHQEFFDAFMMKSVIVEWRRANQALFNLLKYGNTVVFDFDGVIAHYPEGFLEYVAQKEQIYTTVSGLRSPDDLWTQIGMPLETYTRVKREFVEGGGLRRLTPIYDSIKFMEWLKKRGYLVVIVTSRDKSSLEKMELDSYLWLQDHGVDKIINGIYFTLDKSRFIKEHILKVVVVIEDNAAEVGRLREAGIPAVCLHRPYNPNGERFDEIKCAIDTDGENWWTL
jgi:hypothetical protein